MVLVLKDWLAGVLFFFGGFYSFTSCFGNQKSQSHWLVFVWRAGTDLI